MDDDKQRKKARINKPSKNGSSMRDKSGRKKEDYKLSVKKEKKSTVEAIKEMLPFTTVLTHPSNYNGHIEEVYEEQAKIDILSDIKEQIRLTEASLLSEQAKEASEQKSSPLDDLLGNSFSSTNKKDTFDKDSVLASLAGAEAKERQDESRTKPVWDQVDDIQDIELELPELELEEKDLVPEEITEIHLPGLEPREQESGFAGDDEEVIETIDLSQLGSRKGAREEDEGMPGFRQPKKSKAQKVSSRPAQNQEVALTKSGSKSGTPSGPEPTSKTSSKPGTLSIAPLKNRSQKALQALLTEKEFQMEEPRISARKSQTDRNGTDSKETENIPYIDLNALFPDQPKKDGQEKKTEKSQPSQEPAQQPAQTKGLDNVQPPETKSLEGQKRLLQASPFHKASAKPESPSSQASAKSSLQKDIRDLEKLNKALSKTDRRADHSEPRSRKDRASESLTRASRISNAASDQIHPSRSRANRISEPEKEETAAPDTTIIENEPDVEASLRQQAILSSLQVHPTTVSSPAASVSEDWLDTVLKGHDVLKAPAWPGFKSKNGIEVQDDGTSPSLISKAASKSEAQSSHAAQTYPGKAANAGMPAGTKSSGSFHRGSAAADFHADKAESVHPDQPGSVTVSQQDESANAAAKAGYADKTPHTGLSNKTVQSGSDDQNQTAGLVSASESGQSDSSGTPEFGWTPPKIIGKRSRPKLSRSQRRIDQEFDFGLDGMDMEEEARFTPDAENLNELDLDQNTDLDAAIALEEQNPQHYDSEDIVLQNLSPMGLPVSSDIESQRTGSFSVIKDALGGRLSKSEPSWRKAQRIANQSEEEEDENSYSIRIEESEEILIQEVPFFQTQPKVQPEPDQPDSDKKESDLKAIQAAMEPVISPLGLDGNSRTKTESELSLSFDPSSPQQSSIDNALLADLKEQMQESAQIKPKSETISLSDYALQAGFQIQDKPAGSDNQENPKNQSGSASQASLTNITGSASQGNPANLTESAYFAGRSKQTESINFAGTTNQAGSVTDTPSSRQSGSANQAENKEESSLSTSGALAEMAASFRSLQEDSKSPLAILQDLHLDDESSKPASGKFIQMEKPEGSSQEESGTVENGTEKNGKRSGSCADKEVLPATDASEEAIAAAKEALSLVGIQAELEPASVLKQKEEEAARQKELEEKARQEKLAQEKAKAEAEAKAKQKAAEQKAREEAKTGQQTQQADSQPKKIGHIDNLQIMDLNAYRKRKEEERKAAKAREEERKRKEAEVLAARKAKEEAAKAAEEEARRKAWEESQKKALDIPSFGSKQNRLQQLQVQADDAAERAQIAANPEAAAKAVSVAVYEMDDGLTTIADFKRKPKKVEQKTKIQPKSGFQNGLLRTEAKGQEANRKEASSTEANRKEMNQEGKYPSFHTSSSSPDLTGQSTRSRTARAATDQRKLQRSQKSVQPALAFAPTPSSTPSFSSLETQNPNASYLDKLSVYGYGNAAGPKAEKEQAENLNGTETKPADTQVESPNGTETKPAEKPANLESIEYAEPGIKAEQPEAKDQSKILTGEPDTSSVTKQKQDQTEVQSGPSNMDSLLTENFEDQKPRESVLSDPDVSSANVKEPSQPEENAGYPTLSFQKTPSVVETEGFTITLIDDEHPNLQDAADISDRQKPADLLVNQELASDLAGENAEAAVQAERMTEQHGSSPITSKDSSCLVLGEPVSWEGLSETDNELERLNEPDKGPETDDHESVPAFIKNRLQDSAPLTAGTELPSLDNLPAYTPKVDAAKELAAAAANPSSTAASDIHNEKKEEGSAGITQEEARQKKAQSEEVMGILEGVLEPETLQTVNSIDILDDYIKTKDQTFSRSDLEERIKGHVNAHKKSSLKEDLAFATRVMKARTTLKEQEEAQKAIPSDTVSNPAELSAQESAGTKAVQPETRAEENKTVLPETQASDQAFAKTQNFAPAPSAKTISESSESNTEAKEPASETSFVKTEAAKDEAEKAGAVKKTEDQSISAADMRNTAATDSLPASATDILSLTATDALSPTGPETGNTNPNQSREAEKEKEAEERKENKEAQENKEITLSRTSASQEASSSSSSSTSSGQEALSSNDFDLQSDAQRHQSEQSGKQPDDQSGRFAIIEAETIQSEKPDEQSDDHSGKSAIDDAETTHAKKPDEQPEIQSGQSAVKDTEAGRSEFKETATDEPAKKEEEDLSIPGFVLSRQSRRARQAKAKAEESAGFFGKKGKSFFNALSGSEKEVKPVHNQPRTTSINFIEADGPNPNRPKITIHPHSTFATTEHEEGKAGIPVQEEATVLRLKAESETLESQNAGNVQIQGNGEILENNQPQRNGQAQGYVKLQTNPQTQENILSANYANPNQAQQAACQQETGRRPAYPQSMEELRRKVFSSSALYNQIGQPEPSDQYQQPGQYQQPDQFGQPAQYGQPAQPGIQSNIQPAAKVHLPQAIRITQTSHPNLMEDYQTEQIMNAAGLGQAANISFLNDIANAEKEESANQKVLYDQLNAKRNQAPKVQKELSDLQKAQTGMYSHYQQEEHTQKTPAKALEKSLYQPWQTPTSTVTETINEREVLYSPPASKPKKRPIPVLSQGQLEDLYKLRLQNPQMTRGQFQDIYIIQSQYPQLMMEDILILYKEQLTKKKQAANSEKQSSTNAKQGTSSSKQTALNQKQSAARTKSGVLYQSPDTSTISVYGPSTCQEDLCIFDEEEINQILSNADSIYDSATQILTQNGAGKSGATKNPQTSLNEARSENTGKRTVESTAPAMSAAQAAIQKAANAVNDGKNSAISTGNSSDKSSPNSPAASSNGATAGKGGTEHESTKKGRSFLKEFSHKDSSEKGHFFGSKKAGNKTGTKEGGHWYDKVKDVFDSIIEGIEADEFYDDGYIPVEGLEPTKSELHQQGAQPGNQTGGSTGTQKGSQNAVSGSTQTDQNNPAANTTPSSMSQTGSSSPAGSSYLSESSSLTGFPPANMTSPADSSKIGSAALSQTSPASAAPQANADLPFADKLSQTGQQIRPQQSGSMQTNTVYGNTSSTQRMHRVNVIDVPKSDEDPNPLKPNNPYESLSPMGPNPYANRSKKK